MLNIRLEDISEYIRNRIECAREVNPSEEPIMVEPYEARILWGPWVFSLISAAYGTGKTFTGLYFYHTSRKNRDVYATYVNMREIPEELREAPFLKPYYRELNRSPGTTLIDLILPIILDPRGVKKYVNSIKTTIPDELSNIGRQILSSEKGVERILDEFLPNIDKEIIVIIDEFERVVIQEEQLRQLAELARILREYVYDKYGPTKIKLVVLAPEYVLNVNCLEYIRSIFIENQWRHVEGVSKLSVLSSFDKEKLKKLAEKILSELELRDLDGNLPVTEAELDLLCHRCEMFRKTRVSVAKLIHSLSQIILKLVRENDSNIQTLEELRMKLKSGDLTWDYRVREEFIEDLFSDITLEEKVIYDGKYSKLGDKWLKILESFVKDLTENGRKYGYSLLTKRKGFYSYIITSKTENKRWILWLRTSDIRRPDILANHIPYLNPEVSKKSNTTVICLHPIDTKIHKLLEKFSGVEVVALDKYELIALLYNSGHEKVADPETANQDYYELRSKINAIITRR